MNFRSYANTHNPQTSEITLILFAVTVIIGHRTHDGVACETQVVFPISDKPLGSLLHSFFATM
jgi:hypothetical protein